MTSYALGRRPQFDEASRAFPIRELVGTRAPRSYTWACGVNLDQGNDGACVGFAWAAELAARPVVVPRVDNPTGFALYREAQVLDEWPGEDYSGTSVLAGAKAVAARGWMGEYRWAFGVDDLAVAVGWAGPAVIGINWHQDMFEPGGDGFVRPTGVVAGGHAILVRGYSAKARRFLLHNSWGARWGGRGGAPAGCAWIAHDDLGALLADQGDACVPVRRMVSTTAP